MSVVASSVMVMNPDLTTLDAAATLAAATGAVRSRRLAEVADLEVLPAADLMPDTGSDAPWLYTRALGCALQA